MIPGFGPEGDIVQVWYTDQMWRGTNQAASWVSMFLTLERAVLFPDQIKREKGVWWMPWQ